MVIQCQNIFAGGLSGEVSQRPLYNEHGLEKLNDSTTSQFYRGTHKIYLITQLLNLRNRIEILSSYDSI